MNLNHQRTSREWDQIAARADLRAPLTSKKRFVIPAFIFFVIYYFALPVLVSYFPQWMNTSVGPVNIAYLVALSQFLVAWLIAWFYVRAAERWDTRARENSSRYRSWETSAAWQRRGDEIARQSPC